MASQQPHNIENHENTLWYFWGLFGSQWTKPFTPQGGLTWADVQKALKEAEERA